MEYVFKTKWSHYAVNNYIYYTKHESPEQFFADEDNSISATRPINVIQSSYNFLGFINMPKRNLKYDGQLYLRTSFFWDTIRYLSADEMKYDVVERSKC